MIEAAPLISQARATTMTARAAARPWATGSSRMNASTAPGTHLRAAKMTTAHITIRTAAVRGSHQKK